jgi:purine-nucleoside phosphorylase
MISPIGLILGSGWCPTSLKLRGVKEKSFSDVFGVKTSVPGHEGKIIKGKIQNKDVIILSGRLHTYEGYSSYEAAKTIRYLYEQGVKKVILTAAVGGLNPKYQVGDVIILNDVLTVFCQSPLSGPQFQDLSQPFSPALIKIAKQSAASTEIKSHQGVYVYVRGPNFESFADKKALRFLGGDVAGMSIVPEVIMARHLGMEILGLSLVTNLAFVKHDHKDVLAAGKQMEEKLYEFLKNILETIRI